MTRALILGATGGIGRALSARLEAQGAQVTGLSRSADGMDLTRPDTVTEHAGRLAGQSFDLIVNTTGALVIDGHQPEKSLDAVDADAMARQFALNATGVALAIQAFGPLLARDRRALPTSPSPREGALSEYALGGSHC